MGKIIKSDDQFLLYDLQDEAFLGLTKKQIKKLPREFSQYYWHNNESVLENSIDYCYKNFAFAAKFFLNVDLLPYQVAVLETMFYKQFPMIICSRGFSKCARDCYIMTSSGIKYINELFDESDPFMEQLPVNDDILGENGFNSASYKWKNSPTKLNHIKTSMGYSIKCTDNHPIRVVNNGKIEWVDSREVMVGDYIPIDRSPDWFDNTNNLDKDVGYLFGCLVGDGGYTVRGRISFTTADKEFLPILNKTTEKLWGKSFKKQRRDYAYTLHGVAIHDELFEKYGFNSSVCGEKRIPSSVMSSEKQTMAAFMRGLFDTDGYITKRGLIAGYCSKSKRLVEEVQFILTRFGIISNMYTCYNKKYKKDYYHLNFCGEDVKIFAREIGFGIKRKQDQLAKHMNIKCNTNKDIIPVEMIAADVLSLKDKLRKNKDEYNKVSRGDRKRFYLDIASNGNPTYGSLSVLLGFFESLSCEEEYIRLEKIFNDHYYYDYVMEINESHGESYDFYIPDDHSFITNGIISHNSFLLAVYSILRSILVQGSRVVLIASSFRQSKIVFNYINDIYKKSPVLRSICGRTNYPKFDVSACRFSVGISNITALPLGDGQKIRGERGNCILADEFSSIDEEIFQVVVRGFGAVSLDPVSKVKEQARLLAMEESGMDISEYDNPDKGNQIIVSGTAYYQFNHFYDWYQRYLQIIACQNDKKKLRLIMGEETTDEQLSHLDTRQFGVIRVPCEAVPILDESMLAQARATMTKAQFDMEYRAIFYADSEGFIPMSLLKAVSLFEKYPAKVTGDRTKRYVMGIDPAKKRDHFSIVLIELDEEEKRHRVVYCWATNEVKMKKSGEVNEMQTYYAACAKKIRKLLTKFNVALIVMDAGGGGEAIADILQDGSSLLEPTDQKIWEVDNLDQQLYEGRHILKMVASNTSWASTSNHNLRKSIEDFRLLFPVLDSVAIERDITANPDAYNKDFMSKITKNSKKYNIDTLEGISEDIETMKTEIANIVVTATPNGSEHFDLPKLANGGKGAGDARRKDRYSACLLAHHGIQFVLEEENEINVKLGGGTAEELSTQGGDNLLMYKGLVSGGVYRSGACGMVTKSGGGNVAY